MDITGLGMQNPASLYMDSFQITSGAGVHSPENFAEVLRRMSSASEPAGRKQGIQPVDKNDKLYELCLELETFLVKNLLTGMRNTVQKSGLVDDSFAGKMYEDMLYDEYAKDYTKSANFGLAEQAYRQLRGY